MYPGAGYTLIDSLPRWIDNNSSVAGTGKMFLRLLERQVVVKVNDKVPADFKNKFRGRHRWDPTTIAAVDVEFSFIHDFFPVAISLCAY